MANQAALRETTESCREPAQDGRQSVVRPASARGRSRRLPGYGAMTPIRTTRIQFLSLSRPRTGWRSSRRREARRERVEMNRVGREWDGVSRTAGNYHAQGH
jgi:hypothetical protein